jgi:hypothetical protein
MARYLSLMYHTLRHQYGPAPSENIIAGPSFDSNAFGDYAKIALVDPKAPVEFKVMGPVMWAAQLTGVTAGFYIVDPLGYREGGLDDWWDSYDHSGPLRDFWEYDVKSAPSIFGSAPSFWDLW